MKTLKFFAMTVVLWAFMFTLHAQNARVVMVDFMKLPEGGDTEYLKVEQEVWKSMHQEWVNQGKLAGWYLYAIPFPGGTDAEYHYATVRLYNDWGQLEDPVPDMEKVFNKVHKGKDMDMVMKKTLASRDLVKTYQLGSWERFGAEDMSKPSGIIQVVYFKVPWNKWNAYMSMERNYYHPTHKAEIKAGTRYAWEGWMLQQPMGTGVPFQFIATDHYKDWAQYTKSNPKGLYQEVLSQDDLELRDDMFQETVEMVMNEQWRLVDYVDSPTSTATSSGN